MGAWPGCSFAAVNVHHFLLDGAIWKLRDGRIARALLREEPVVPEPIVPGPRFGPRLAWAACAAAVAMTLVHAWELEFGVRRPLERGDLARPNEAIDHLRWIGRESHAVHQNVGLPYARNGDFEAARYHLERSLALLPTVEAWTALGNLERLEGLYDAAVTALESAIALNASYPAGPAAAARAAPAAGARGGSGSRALAEPRSRSEAAYTVRSTSPPPIRPPSSSFSRP